MLYGVPYELFWHLNPTKLEPFKKAYLLSKKEEARLQDVYGWVYGRYVMEAIGAAFSKEYSYPESPRSAMKSNENNKQVMSDGARFAAFALAHRKALEDKRKA